MRPIRTWERQCDAKHNESLVMTVKTHMLHRAMKIRLSFVAVITQISLSNASLSSKFPSHSFHLSRASDLIVRPAQSIEHTHRATHANYPTENALCIAILKSANLLETTSPATTKSPGNLRYITHRMLNPDKVNLI